MKIRVIVEYDENVNSYSVFCPELPGCACSGDTEEEALKNIKEAIELYLEPSPIKFEIDTKVYELEIDS